MHPYQTVSTGLLYSNVIEDDGRIKKEPTLLGAVLIGIAFIVLISALVFLAF